MSEVVPKMNLNGNPSESQDVVESREQPGLSLTAEHEMNMTNNNTTGGEIPDCGAADVAITPENVVEIDLNIVVSLLWLRLYLRVILE